MSWKKVKLSQICDIQIGRTPDRNNASYWGKGYNWVSIRDLKTDSVSTTKEEITEAGVKECNCKLIPADTLLMSFKLSIGKLAFNKIPLYTNEAIAALIVKDKSIIYNRYLYYALQVADILKDTDRAVMGATLNKKKLAEIEVILPPLEEQKRIAEVLDKADRLRQKDRQLLAKYDQLLQSVFLDMFGDVNPETGTWKTVAIKDIAAPDKGSMRTGPFGSDLLHSEFVDEGVFVLGIDNVVNNRFEWGKARFILEQKYEKLKRYKVYPGDVLISIMATTGRTAVVPNNMPEAINSKHLAAITLNRKLADPTFISYSLHKDPKVVFQLSAQNRGAIMNGLNLGIIKETKINLPPLALQNKFASIVNQVEKLKENSAEGIDKSETLFQSLLQKAFKGELALQEAKAVL